MKSKEVVEDQGSYQWVNRARQRRVIMMSLYLDSMSPMEISIASRKYGIRVTLSNLSPILKGLIKAGLLEVAGKEANGRLYSLTEKGRDIRERLRHSPYFQGTDPFVQPLG